MRARDYRQAGLVASAAALAVLSAPAVHAADAQDFSPAERLIFMTDQLHDLKLPTTLHYSFKKSGALEPGFEDGVSVQLTAKPDGSCCNSQGEFLSGEHRVAVPEVEQAKGNPVTLYFLERDIGEMHRLAKGQQNYFRKRVRMAIYNGATVQDVSLGYRGHDVAAKQVAIDPYLDDPVRSRYDKYARKRYTFWLSDAVPGGVYGIRTVMSAEDASGPPLIVEEMYLDGAAPPSPGSKP